jgi:hypothetical protein
LPRFEDRLSLFPSGLRFLNRVTSLRAMAGFGVMYWFYTQLEDLGRRGRALPDLSVLAATRRVLGQQKALLADR